MPDLALTFAGDVSHLEVRLEKPITHSHDDIDREKQLIRLKYKKLSHEEEKDEPPGGKVSAIARAIARMERPSPEAVDSYNTALERFYEQYGAWLLANALQVNRSRRTVKMNLELANCGTAPAEDIDLFLHFPDGFALYSESDLPRPPAEPAPPEKPRGGLALPMPRLPVDFGNIFSPSLLAGMGPRNVSSPSIRRTNSYEVRFHVKSLKHGMVVSLDPLYAVFDSHESARSFSIEYHIVAANLPRPTDRKLHVVVQQSQTA